MNGLVKRLVVPGVLIGAATTGVLNAQEVAEPAATLDLGRIFEAAPIIYSVLLVMSVLSFAIWVYSLVTLRLKDMAPQDFVNHVRQLLAQRRFEAALTACQQEENFCSNIIASGIAARRHGPQVMMDAMHAEGQRSGNSLWQRISLLSDVAVIAPMLGLLGTVLGLFFAFYDNNQTAESLNNIFNGLGIAIGTTVAGLIVAIMAMVFYTSLKFRLVNLLNSIENEVLSLVSIVELDGESTGATPSPVAATEGA